MEYTITGVLSQKTKVEIGSGARGAWKRQTFVIQNEKQQLALIAWGEKADSMNTLRMGTELTAYFKIDSREYSGRWYSDLNIERIKVLSTV